MELTLREAGHLLGKTPRQLRYLIQNGRIAARKQGKHWLLERESLPLSEAQLRSRERKAHELRGVVEDALGPHLAPPGRRRYSVQATAAFSVGRPIFAAARERLGDDHPAVEALRDALVAVTQGCHRFHHREKLEAYRDGREHASRAVALLLLDPGVEVEALTRDVEEELLPALTGLIRRSERRARR